MLSSWNPFSRWVGLRDEFCFLEISSTVVGVCVSLHCCDLQRRIRRHLTLRQQPRPCPRRTGWVWTHPRWPWRWGCVGPTWWRCCWLRLRWMRQQQVFFPVLVEAACKYGWVRRGGRGKVGCVCVCANDVRVERREEVKEIRSAVAMWPTCEVWE